MNKLIGALIIFVLMVIFAAIIYSMVAITGKPISVSNTYESGQPGADPFECINGWLFINRGDQAIQVVDPYGRPRMCRP
jgi:hypothetical protein